MKKIFYISLFLIPYSLSFNCDAQTISTIAGDNIGGYSGDGNEATSSELFHPYKVVFNNSGVIYIVDGYNNVVRMINSSGTISTIVGNGYNAGTGHGGYNGDIGPATAIELANPTGIAIDKIGNIYVSDFHNYVVRKVNTMGIISTIAGNHLYGVGYSGNGGPATDAELSYPNGLAIDTSGNLYISDCDNGCVRRVDTSGIIRTFAGMQKYSVGYSGDGGPATNAELNTPSGLCFDDTGNLYIADYWNQVIRKVNTSGIISTVAGNSYEGYSGDAGVATLAELFFPNDVSTDASGNLYIADGMNNVIRVVDNKGIIRTIVGDGYEAGTGYGGYSGDGGVATAAELFEPSGVTFALTGNLYIADNGNNVIRKVSIPTSINVIKQENIISIFPNPSSGTFTLSLSNITEKCNIEIYNIVGEKVYSNSCQPHLNGSAGQASANSYQLDLSGQPNGIYLYRVLKEDGSLVGEGKLVIQK